LSRTGKEQIRRWEVLVTQSQIQAALDLQVIPNEESLAPVQAMEGMHIARANDTIDTKMDNMMQLFIAWTL